MCVFYPTTRSVESVVLSSNAVYRERSALVSNAIYRTTALMMNNLGTDLIEISNFTKMWELLHFLTTEIHS